MPSFIEQPVSRDVTFNESVFPFNTERAHVISSNPNSNPSVVALPPLLVQSSQASVPEPVLSDGHVENSVSVATNDFPTEHVSVTAPCTSSCTWHY